MAWHRNREDCSMLKAAIFGMDGVIIDSHPLHKRAWRTFLESVGREVADQELEFVLDGRRRDEILKFFLGHLDERQIRDFGEQKNKFFYDLVQSVRLTAGFREFVEELERQAVKLAVATSATRSRTEYILDRFDLRRRFTIVVTGNDVPQSKPAPAIFSSACAQLGESASRAVVFEDAVSGVKGALRAGMKCVGIADEKRARLLYQAGADHVCRDFTLLSVSTVHGLFAAERGGAQGTITHCI
jgi:HAD superfamily hydrolase (TIGR01509 family)